MTAQQWLIRPGQAIGPIRLGARRGDFLAAVRESGVEHDADDEDPSFVTTTSPYVDATLVKRDGWKVVQVTTGDDEVKLAGDSNSGGTGAAATEGASVIGLRLDEALVALGVRAFDRTLWRSDSPLDWDGDEHETAPETAPPDETLLQSGTLWLLDSGIGISLHRGHVDAIAIRELADLPPTGHGPLTETQLELALAAKREPTYTGAVAKPPPSWMNWLQTLLFIVCAGTIGGLIWLTYRDHTLWSEAPTAEGTIVVIDPPEAVFPDRYTIEYTPGEGNKRTITLPANEVSGLKRLGDPVELKYLTDRPEVAHPTAWARDVQPGQWLMWIPWCLGGYGAMLLASVMLQGVWEAMSRKQA